MLKRRLLLLASILYSFSISAQYRGGINDGFVFTSVSNINATPNINKGGNEDGFSFITVSNQNAGPGIYKGSSNDGFAFVSTINQNAVPNIYTGGNNDGFSFINVINQNAIPNIYTGGNNDGFSFINVLNQNAVPNIYTGGSNDGFNYATALALNATPGIYTGGINDGWTNLLATNQNPSVSYFLSADLKLFIEGFYVGNNLMQPVLFNNALSNDPTACDSITVVLHDAQNAGIELGSAKTILHANGVATVLFSDTLLNHSTFIAVKHRNAIETWSATSINLNGNNTYDFTTAQSKAYGNNMIDVGIPNSEPSKWAFFSGDISNANTGVGQQDGIIESQDYLDLENAVSIVLTGYFVQDITGDGIVESLDYTIMENNVTSIIFTIHP